MRSPLSLTTVTCAAFLMLFPRGAAAQTPASAAPVASVSQTEPAGPPRVIAMSGTLVDSGGQPHAGSATLSFAFYADQQGGNALWTETQTVQADERGRYTVRLGTETPLPVELFQATEARWLGVRNADGVEPARVRLLSVPYALKAADAETLGGLPATAYVRANGTSTGADGQPTAPGTAAAGNAGIVPNGFENTGSPYNTAYGYQALLNNTGFYNAAFGWSAIRSNTTGEANTASGLEALYSNTSGSQNTALGFLAGFANTNGNNNTAVGTSALQNNSSGSGNVAVGLQAGLNATGSNNVYIANTGAAGENGATYVGTEGLQTKTVLAGNVGIGTATPVNKLDLRATTGSAYAGITGTFGGNAGVILNNLRADGTSSGSAILKSNAADGSFTIDTPISSEVLRLTPDGKVGINNRNPGNALTVTAAASSYVQLMSLGGNAGHIFTAGGKEAVIRLNIADGSFTWENPNGTERMRITQSGNVGIGTATPTQPLQMGSGAFVSTGGVWTNASSRTLKHDIADLSGGQAIDTLVHLQPVSFQYNAEPGRTHIGFIAEDVPELVATEDRKGLAAMDILAVVTKVVQEQQATIHAQSTTIDELTARLTKLEALVTALSASTGGRER